MYGLFNTKRKIDLQNGETLKNLEIDFFVPWDSLEHTRHQCDFYELQTGHSPLSNGHQMNVLFDKLSKIIYYSYDAYTQCTPLIFLRYIYVYM